MDHSSADSFLFLRRRADLGLTFGFSKTACRSSSPPGVGTGVVVVPISLGREGLFVWNLCLSKTTTVVACQMSKRPRWVHVKEARVVEIIPHSPTTACLVTVILVLARKTLEFIIILIPLVGLAVHVCAPLVLSAGTLLNELIPTVFEGCSTRQAEYTIPIYSARRS